MWRSFVFVHEWCCVSVFPVFLSQQLAGVVVIFCPLFFVDFWCFLLLCICLYNHILYSKPGKVYHFQLFIILVFYLWDFNSYNYSFFSFIPQNSLIYIFCHSFEIVTSFSTPCYSVHICINMHRFQLVIFIKILWFYHQQKLFYEHSKFFKIQIIVASVNICENAYT